MENKHGISQDAINHLAVFMTRMQEKMISDLRRDIDRIEAEEAPGSDAWKAAQKMKRLTNELQITVDKYHRDFPHLFANNPTAEEALDGISGSIKR